MPFHLHINSNQDEEQKFEKSNRISMTIMCKPLAFWSLKTLQKTFISVFEYAFATKTAGIVEHLCRRYMLATFYCFCMLC